MRPSIEPGSPKDWLRSSRSDLALARIEPGTTILPEMLCFHAQQAAEKALKVLLLHLGHEPPRTHSIPLLLSLVDELVALAPGIRSSAILTDYAVTTRYPGLYEPVTLEERDAAVALAQNVIEWVEESIGANAPPAAIL